MKKLRIVVDTNLWISFIIKARLVEFVTFLLDNNITVYTSKELILELEDVLNRPKIKKYLSQPVSEYISFHRQVTINTKIKKKIMKSTDPKDNYLLDLSLSARAAYLVTGDKLLLSVPTNDAFMIVTFSQLKADIASR